ncbi:Lrp/AsnC family transcriptional regulator [Methylobacterium dankookense]|uniref:DNA-binding transcriptional activator DecR n=1 Tax=Methylobacterium dankookense TaxID=560405 RepID=A0A564FU23_9HYPH|nr:Lrp/AsnC family transcriptional regulator [Methylobacterium dankookense]GJD58230.1 DNA-binding transcriptional activator DecR [Methylobacterium dankookense]VUF11298.1 DNA-binding transcriptional activator DecR [Methylobacterium dankookense]
MQKTPSDMRNGKREDRPEIALDAIDRRILDRLQRDSTVSNQDLAHQVGLSPPACLKRVRALRSAGIITRTVAILSPEVLGYPMITVARVKLELANESANHAFEARMAELPRVVQCMTVAGDYDYVLLIRSRDVGHYQDFARRVLKLAPGIRSYTSEIVLQVHKATTELPIDPV